MDGQWLSYRELANRLGVGVEAARRRAQRARWSRQYGNDGKTRVHLPDDYEIERRPDGAGAVLPLHPDGAPDVRAEASGLVHALESNIKTLEAHVETLREQLAAAEARAEKRATDFAELDARHVAAIAQAEARADREAEKAGKAIEAFSALADRLDALAQERARPWWRRLTG
jgi:hypothetical protein